MTAATDSTAAPILLCADAAIAAPLVAALAQQAPQLQLLPFRRDLGDATLARIEVVLGWRFPPGVAGRPSQSAFAASRRARTAAFTLA